ncbi:hypothetical protein ACB092_03G033800 [Castanea dentata]
MLHYSMRPLQMFHSLFHRTCLHLERRLCSILGLPNITTELADANARHLKVFVAKELCKDQYLDGPAEHFLAKALCKDRYFLVSSGFLNTLSSSRGGIHVTSLLR